MEQQLFGALIAIVVGVGACALYYFASNKILDLALPFRQRPAGGQEPEARRGDPAVAVPRPGAAHPRRLPGLSGHRARSGSASSTGPARTSSASRTTSGRLDDGEFRQSIFNNLFWLVVVPAMSTFFGLVIAFLTDRIWWGNIAKTLIFMPMAISFVGASVIWKFIYDYRSRGLDPDRRSSTPSSRASAASRRRGSPSPSGTTSS